MKLGSRDGRLWEGKADGVSEKSVESGWVSSGICWRLTGCGKGVSDGEEWCWFSVVEFELELEGRLKAMVVCESD